MLTYVVPTGATFSGWVYTGISEKDKKITVTPYGLESTTLKGATVDLLRWSPAYEEYQVGEIGTPGSSTFTAGQSKWSCRVNFPRAFSQPPQVVTCFERFAMASNQPWRLTCKATDIDKTGFTPISTLGGVVSGDVSLMDTLRSKGKLYWPSGAFSKKPRICFVGLRYINSDNNADGLNFGIDYTIEDDYVKFTFTDEGRLEGASFTYILIE
ncbi:hypothetical protein JB92DRAFT_3146669 [Gautieria morchelliformis]|nr:hypothetical protein JB92DRAFT_3146669 [Gautieria morchelliformis]